MTLPGGGSVHRETVRQDPCEHAQRPRLLRHRWDPSACAACVAAGPAPAHDAPAGSDRRERLAARLPLMDHPAGGAPAGAPVPQETTGADVDCAADQGDPLLEHPEDMRFDWINRACHLDGDRRDRTAATTAGTPPQVPRTDARRSDRVSL